MSSLPLVDRYKRYKRGTEKLSSWLLDTSRTAAQRVGVTTKLTARLSMKDFVELARLISDSKPPIHVPQDILVVVQDVIDGRTVCATWFAELAQANTAQPRSAVSQLADKDSHVVDNDNESFAIWCLLQDFEEIRTSVKEAWRSYHTGELSFSVAAKLTNTAFAMMRDLDDAFIETFPSLNTFNKIVNHLGIEALTSRDDIVAFSMHDGSSTANEERPDTKALELFCISAWCVLSDFRAICDAGIRGEPCDFLSQTSFQPHPFATALYSIYQDVITLSARAEDFHNVEGFITDEFTRALM